MRRHFKFPYEKDRFNYPSRKGRCAKGNVPFILVSLLHNSVLLLNEFVSVFSASISHKMSPCTNCQQANT